MRNLVREHVKCCDTCQRCKRMSQKRKCRHLPAKTAEVTPWETLCADLIGPHVIKRPPMCEIQPGKKHPKKIECEPLILKAVTMIDPATGWFEIAKHDDKCAITVANIIERTWLNRCPWPDKINLDRGKELIRIDFKDMARSSHGGQDQVHDCQMPTGKCNCRALASSAGHLVLHI